MIEKSDSGIRAIHKLIIHARLIAGTKNSTSLVKFLDELEYLPALMLESENQSELFESYLKEICNTFDLGMVYEQYVNS